MMVQIFVFKRRSSDLNNFQIWLCYWTYWLWLSSRRN